MNSPYTTIVSGLPRSGTSMMMQVLSAGGIEPLTDHVRKEDEDNPKGYYEYEPVKRTKADPSWVPEARGKSVKMVYSLLYDLPDGYKYRVLFMDRDINEVIASQKTMLKRLGREGAKVGDGKLKELFKTDIDRLKRWLAWKCNFTVLYINHKEMIISPFAQCNRINKFLDNILDIAAASTVVDPDLYRNRID